MHCFLHEGEMGPWAGKVAAGESVFPSLLVGSEPTPGLELVLGLILWKDWGGGLFKRQEEEYLTT